MVDRYPPIHPKCPHFLHGGDYNPDQWPEAVWDEDMRLMKLAGCNAMSVGIFGWVRHEPEEGVYTFEWMDRVLDLLAKNDMFAVLATPSGSKPAWMSRAYPEVCRMTPDGRREPHRLRHNHCYTSPVYREKVTAMNTRLAERYKDHPALLVWHLSNEYGGDCHCDLCWAEFRKWLQARYETLDALNQAWWSAFWSHTFTDWEEIRALDGSMDGMIVDWKRFVTDRTVDFFRHEIEPLKRITPDVPVTTNFMGFYDGFNPWKMAPYLDVASWDNYPDFESTAKDPDVAAAIGFAHDFNRCFKGGRPFMLMESTPSSCNWKPFMKLKRPGLHRLSSLQAVAHGADTVQYFQWRKGRGGTEKFHGAVVDHHGGEKTRVFRDVAAVGEALQKLDGVIGSTVRPEVALIYDWENRWAIDATAGPRQQNKAYAETCVNHYRPFWERGIPVDILPLDADVSGYKVVLAPMLYMLPEETGARLAEFVRAGGVLVTTYWSGLVNESLLCHTTGFPGPLRECMGVWAEEIDSLSSDARVPVAFEENNSLGLAGDFEARELCDLIHAEGAEVLATYRGEFYAGRPAFTLNRFGEGGAYYMAFRGGRDFLDCFYGDLAIDLGLARALDTDLPDGVTAQVRGNGEATFVFLLNFTPEEQTVDGGETKLTDAETGEAVANPIVLPPHGSRVFVKG